MSHHDRLPARHFFLSYARGDDSDSIQRFYDDLCAEVRDHAGLPRGTEVGFLDVQNIDIGESWSARLTWELSRCSTFLALISPRYLRSEMCGKEWTVFATRQARSTRRGGDLPAALLPLLWVPPTVLPPVVGEFQYENNLLPQAYGDRGLRQMIRLDRYRNDYLEFVYNLARQIVRLAEQPAVPPITVPLDLQQVSSAFHPMSGPGPGPDDHTPIDSPSSTAVTNTSELGVRFVVAAPSISDLRSSSFAPLGRETRFYGQASVDWSPYLPELATSLADFAQQVAEQQEFTSIVSDIAGLPEALVEARAAGQAVVLLIDLWVTHLEEARRILRKYDLPEPSGTWPPTAVLVPVSAADTHTQMCHEELGQALRTLLSNRLRRLDGVLSRTSILSHRSFDADLRVVLERVRSQGFRTRPPYHRPPGSPGDRPILQGP